MVIAKDEPTAVLTGGGDPPPAAAPPAAQPGDGSSPGVEGAGRAPGWGVRLELATRRWCESYRLSRCETEIMLLAVQGVPREDIAKRRGVDQSTIKKQVQFLLAKSGARSLVHAALRVFLEEVLGK